MEKINKNFKLKVNKKNYVYVVNIFPPSIDELKQMVYLNLHGSVDYRDTPLVLIFSKTKLRFLNQYLTDFFKREDENEMRIM